MNTVQQLYWLTVAYNFINVLILLGILSVVALIFTIMHASIEADGLLAIFRKPEKPATAREKDRLSEFKYIREYSEQLKEYNEFRIYRRLIRTFAGIITFGITVAIFLPSKKELIFIYAAGNTAEYLKKDSTAQQLPAKVIRYIDAAVDNGIENFNHDKK